MNVYIIGIPSKYRGQVLEKELEKRNIRFSRSDGVIVSQIPQEVLAKKIDIKSAKILARRKLTAGEIGCALAHQQVYQQALSAGQNFVLVYEDDASIISDLLPNIKEFMDVKTPRIVMACYDPGTVWAGTKEINHGLYRLAVPPTLTTAYWVNAAAMRVLVDAATPLTFVADWPVKSFSQIEFYAPDSPLVIPAIDTESTIHGRPIEGGKGKTKRVFLRSVRYISVFTHFRWFVYKNLYGNYKNYVIHEVLRFPIFSRLRAKSGNENFDYPMIKSKFADFAIYLFSE